MAAKQRGVEEDFAEWSAQGPEFAQKVAEWRGQNPTGEMDQFEEGVNLAGRNAELIAKLQQGRR